MPSFDANDPSGSVFPGSVEWPEHIGTGDPSSPNRRRSLTEPQNRKSYKHRDSDVSFDGMLQRSASSRAHLVAIPDHGHDDRDGVHFSWKLFMAYCGPGLLMSVAYVDPGNLESDLQAGAFTGYRLMWVLLGSTVLGLLLQVLAARIGVVTGKDLATLCRENCTQTESHTLWAMTQASSSLAHHCAAEPAA